LINLGKDGKTVLKRNFREWGASKLPELTGRICRHGYQHGHKIITFLN